MLNEINATQPVHVVTLEDPIEFVHAHKSATFNQRELGADFDDFPSGLRSALRQAPKVILVGEMRDRATVEIALTAAETGHLVLSTIHTINAGQTINRILGMFELAEEAQLRLRLAKRCATSSASGSRRGSAAAACLINEIMGSNLRVREADRARRSGRAQLLRHHRGQRDLRLDHLRPVAASRLRGGPHHRGTANLYATNKAKMTRYIDNVRKRAGLESDQPTGLRLDLGTSPTPAPAPPPLPGIRLA